MKERLDEIGSRLAELREISGISAEDTPELLQVPVEIYNDY